MTSLDQLINEREKIKRALHDNLAATLTSAAFLSIFEMIPKEEYRIFPHYIGYGASASFLILATLLLTSHTYQIIRNSLQIKRYD